MLRLLTRAVVSTGSTAARYVFDTLFRRIFLDQGDPMVSAGEIADWLAAAAESPAPAEAPAPPAPSVEIPSRGVDGVAEAPAPPTPR